MDLENINDYEIFMLHEMYVSDCAYLVIAKKNERNRCLKKFPEEDLEE